MAAESNPEDGTAGGVVVRLSARPVLRSLRPVVRAVLEDVAVDAVWRDGRLVAETSARRVAEHIGVDPGTAASALRVLRDRGFVELVQATGPGGRFGLAGYTVHLPEGIEVVRPPCGERPLTSPPRSIPPLTVAPRSATTTPNGNRRSNAKPTSKRVEQGALDLGLGDR
jgi:hypothetical protein